MLPQTPSVVAPVAPAILAGRERSIRLSIVGEELVLDGRFDHWVPMASEGAGDEASVQLLFDVTGVASDADGQVEGDLFTFTATSVERIGPLAFAVQGTMRRGDTQRRARLVVQTPAAHTPFVVITFSFDRALFSDIWDEVTNVLEGHRLDAEPHLYPRAWLRVPDVAEA